MLLTNDYPIELFETISSKRLKFLIAKRFMREKKFDNIYINSTYIIIIILTEIILITINLIMTAIKILII